MAVQTSDKKLDGAGLNTLWGLIKGIVPTKTSDITNDSNFVVDASYVHTDNNFATALKNKLDGIASGATAVYENTVSAWGFTKNAAKKVKIGAQGNEYTADANNVITIPAYPTSLPASDVYAWAKASTKPSYTLDEVSDGSTRKLADYLPLAGGTMNGGIYWGDKGNIENGWNSYGSMDGLLMLNSSITNSGAPPNYYSVGIHVGGSNYWYQLAFERGNQYLKYRGGNIDGDTTGGWRTLLHDSNYTNYALPLTGGTLTGSLYVNNSWLHANDIRTYGYLSFSAFHDANNAYGTGTCSMYFNQKQDLIRIDSVSNISIKGNKVWHEGNDGSGSGLDADLLDGKHASAFAPASVFVCDTGGDIKYYKISNLWNTEAYVSNVYIISARRGESYYVTCGRDGSSFNVPIIKKIYGGYGKIESFAYSANSFYIKVNAYSNVIHIEQIVGDSAAISVSEVSQSEYESATVITVDNNWDSSNTYVSNGKGYIGDTEITNVNNVGGIGIANIVYAINGSGFGTSEATGISDSLTRTQFWRDNSKSGAGAIGVFVAHSTASTYGWEFYTGYFNDGDFYGRIKAGGTWGNRYTFLTSANYTSYAVARDSSAMATGIAGIDLNGMANNAGHGGIINFHYNGSSSATSYIKETNGDRIDFHTSGGEGYGFVRIRNHGTGARIQGVVLNSGNEWAYNIARVTVAGDPYTNPTVILGQDGEPCVINASALDIVNLTYPYIHISSGSTVAAIDGVGKVNGNDYTVSLIHAVYQNNQTPSVEIGDYGLNTIIKGDEVSIYGSDEFLFIGEDVGIGTRSPLYKLHVSGAVGATAFTNTSDIRNKNVIDDKTITVKNIADAPLFRFTWKDSRIDADMHVGSSAQYWLTILPELVTTAHDDIGTLSMQYGTIALASAICIARKVESQEEKIARLEARVRELENAQAN